ncbi:hypothetical protein D3C78_641390 [compost metagenome]
MTEVIANLVPVYELNNLPKSGKVRDMYDLLQTKAYFVDKDNNRVPFNAEDSIFVRRGKGKPNIWVEVLSEARVVAVAVWKGEIIEITNPGIDSITVFEWRRVATTKEAAVDVEAAAAASLEMPNEARLVEQMMEREALNSATPVETKFVFNGVEAKLTWDRQSDLDLATTYASSGVMIDNVLEVVARNVRNFPGTPASIKIGIITDGAGAVPDVAVLGHVSMLYRVDLIKQDLDLIQRDVHVNTSLSVPVLTISEVVINGTASMPGLPGPDDAVFNQSTGDVDCRAVVNKKDLEEATKVLTAAVIDDILGMVVQHVITGPLALKHTSMIHAKIITTGMARHPFVLIEKITSGDCPEYIGELFIADLETARLLPEQGRVPFATQTGLFVQLTQFESKSGRFDRIVRETSEPGSVFGGSGRRLRQDHPNLHLDVERGSRREEPAVDPKIPTREWIPQIKQYVHIEGDRTLYFIADYDQLNNMFLLQLADSARRERDSRIDSRYRDSRQTVDGLVPVEPGRLRPFVLFH